MNTDDPALWIDKLKVIIKRLGGIDKKYEKGDIEMISYIMANHLLKSGHSFEGKWNCHQIN